MEAQSDVSNHMSHSLRGPQHFYLLLGTTEPARGLSQWRDRRSARVWRIAGRTAIAFCRLFRLDTAQSCTRCYGIRHSSGMRQRVRTRRDRRRTRKPGRQPAFYRSRRKQQALFEALSAKEFPLSPGPFLKSIDASGAGQRPLLLRRKRIVC